MTNVLLFRRRTGTALCVYRDGKRHSAPYYVSDDGWVAIEHPVYGSLAGKAGDYADVCAEELLFRLLKTARRSGRLRAPKVGKAKRRQEQLLELISTTTRRDGPR